MTNYVHSEEFVERVCEAWKKGHSSSAIARMMGTISRNAVIGIVHRHGGKHGIQFQKRVPRDKGENRWRPAKKDAGRKRQEPRINRAKIVAALKTEPLPPAQPQDQRRVSIELAEPHHCRFIPGDPRGVPRDAPLYCGEQTVPGLSYCAHHARRCYTVPPVGIREYHTHRAPEPAEAAPRRPRVFA
jgi:GcrA cell cycle regulator